MEGEYHIELDDKVEPVVHPPRRVPKSLLERLKLKLQEVEERDFIQKVDIPTPWVNSLVIVEKRDGSLRLCLDPRDSNKAIPREHHRIPTAEDMVSRLTGKKVYSIVDEKNGFWQVPLDDESSYLCHSVHLTAVIALNECPSALSPPQKSFRRRMNIWRH